jgi:predicted alpha/beta superfamily hydrolase
LPLLFLLARCASAPAEEAQTTTSDVADTAADGEDTSAAADTTDTTDTAGTSADTSADTSPDTSPDTSADTSPDTSADTSPDTEDTADTADAEDTTATVERADRDRDGDHVDDAHDLDPDDPSIGLRDDQPANTTRLIVASAPVGTPHLAGDFNGWIQTPLTIGPLGLFEAAITPLSGSASLQYKFTAGDWSREESGFRGPTRNRTLPASTRAAAAIIRAWGSEAATASTAIGDLQTLPALPAPELGRSATVRILLPPGYATVDRHYPVLYMQDGQNLFDGATAAFGTEWQADEAAWVGQLEGAHSGLIIVGIDNAASRSCDYTPFTGAVGCETGTPRGEDYADFVANTLKPVIDSRFRTLADRRNTFIGGSSRGGLAALVTALRHQETFSAVMGLSATTLSAITGGDFAAYAASHPRTAPIRFSLDYGDAEVVYDNNATLLIGAMNSTVAALTAAGFDAASITTAIIPGAVHNEAAWAARLPGRLTWLLDPTAN